MFRIYDQNSLVNCDIIKNIIDHEITIDAPKLQLKDYIIPFCWKLSTRPVRGGKIPSARGNARGPEIRAESP